DGRPFLFRPRFCDGPGRENSDNEDGAIKLEGGSPGVLRSGPAGADVEVRTVCPLPQKAEPATRIIGANADECFLHVRRGEAVTIRARRLSLALPLVEPGWRCRGHQFSVLRFSVFSGPTPLRSWTVLLKLNTEN